MLHVLLGCFESVAMCPFGNPISTEVPTRQDIDIGQSLSTIQMNVECQNKVCQFGVLSALSAFVEESASASAHS